MAETRLGAGVLLGLLLLFSAVSSWAAEPVRRLGEIEIRNDDGRTTTGSIRAISRLYVGQDFTPKDVERARRRLLSSGLFSEVVLFHEVLENEEVRVVIAVREKISWVVAPTFALSSANVGGGLVYAENNLWGRNKKFAAGGQLTTGESGIFIGFLDPLLFGIPALRWSAELQYRNERIQEYAPDASEPNPEILRQTRLEIGSVASEFAVVWFEWFRTAAKYRYGLVDARTPDDIGALGPPMDPGAARVDATLRVAAGVDTRENIHAVTEGINLEGSYELSHPDLGSRFAYRKLGVLYRHGIRFFDTGNLILRAEAVLGYDLPFHAEVTSGGTNLRGYLYRQFRGDTKFSWTSEVHHQLFRVGPLSVRGLLFYDTGLTLYRDFPDDRRRLDDGGVLTRAYLPEQREGLKQAQLVHGVGAGMRLYLSNIVLPLLGVDVGYSPNSAEWRVYLVAGVTPG